MILVIENRDTFTTAPTEAAPNAGERSTAIALRHMGWPFATTERRHRRRPRPLRDPAPRRWPR
ncbi:hypothetical protein [Arenimonas fontis]|uniref:Uncharacterized protein n=1 Tax=Arenimonas fontis TaxID=2608255 RepID=A0A5B2ZCS7_9GAMM|nr:hypothetical protein [Arenimonas fontis]KAA2285020.1 hypothetical protein F0415_07190 [Arenimonas fontis]